MSVTYEAYFSSFKYFSIISQNVLMFSPKEKPPSIKGKPEIRVDGATRTAVLLLRVTSASPPTAVQWSFKDAPLAQSDRIAFKNVSKGDEHELTLTITDVRFYKER